MGDINNYSWNKFLVVIYENLPCTIQMALGNNYVWVWTKGYELS